MYEFDFYKLTRNSKLFLYKDFIINTFFLRILRYLLKLINIYNYYNFYSIQNIYILLFLT